MHLDWDSYGKIATVGRGSLPRRGTKRMERIVYGTGNQAKLQMMQDILAPLPIEIIGLTSVLSNIPDVDESGNDPLENAVLKATAYYKILQ